MKKIWSIAKWEFLERVKNRLFIITLITAPILILTVGAAAGMLTETSLDYTKVIGISSTNQVYFSSVSSELEKIEGNNNQPKFITIALNESQPIVPGMVDGILEIDETNGNIKTKIIYYWSLSPLEVNQIERATEKAIYKSKIKILDNSILLPNIEFDREQASNGTADKEDFNSFFFTSFTFLFLFIVVIIFSGSNFVRALIEEKSTHINEILLSSSSPKEILFGKYLGLLLIGLLQTLFWFVVSYFFFSKGSLNLSVTPNYLLLLVYFVLGYLLYTSIFLAIGAQVSSEGESQQVTTLVSLFLLIPIVLSGQILISPDSLMSTIFTYLPVTTVPLMLMKINITEVSLTEIITTISIQLISIFLVISIASKYFANGLRQFEKRKRK